MKKGILFVFALTSLMVSQSSFAQQQKAQKELCNYHNSGKDRKKDRKNLEDRIEKLANKFLNTKKKNQVVDAKYALIATAQSLKETDFCITEAIVVQNDYANPQTPSAFTLYLYVNNSILLGVTFENKKTFSIYKIFESKEDHNDFALFANNDDQIINDYTPLLGSYYNIHLPEQQLELTWDSKMNSLSVSKNNTPTFYFSTKELPSILSNGFGFWQEYNIKIVAFNEDTILLVHDAGTKKELITVYRRQAS